MTELYGFENPGNNCFLNASLNIFTRIPLVKEFVFTLASEIVKHSKAGTNPHPDIFLSERSSIFFRHLVSLYAAIRKHASTEYVSFKLDSFIKFYYGYMDFDYNQQQDAHECIASLTNDFLDDLAFEGQRKFNIDTTILLPDFQETEESAQTVQYLNKSFSRKLMCGIKSSTLQCQQCNHVSKRMEHFSELVVNIPNVTNINTAAMITMFLAKKRTNTPFSKLPVDVLKHIGQYVRAGNWVTVSHCIDLNFQIEHLTGDELWKCPECDDMVEAFKAEELTVSPRVLFIVFKRFQSANNFVEPETYRQLMMNQDKDQTPIRFPLEGLDMSNYSEDNPIYNCVGIIDHLGRNRGHGHYVAHAKINDKWHMFNDEKCWPWSAKTSYATSKDAYILVYQK